MMAKKKPKPLKRVQWRAEYAAFLVVERLVGLFSMKSLWRIGANLSCLAYLFRSRWPIVRNNLRTVLGPGASEDEIASLRVRVTMNTQKVRARNKTLQCIKTSKGTFEKHKSSDKYY